MCILSGAEAGAAEDRRRKRAEISVSSTRLFARLDGGAQHLVYQMAIDASAESVMVLPLPVARVADDAIDFVDLSRIPALFDRLHACFERPRSRGGLDLEELSLPAPQGLVVHTVGSFEASWVPSLADMNRLDPRFRLDDQVWRDLPQLAGFGFAVFRLQPGAHTIHPMAMTFPTREPDTLYFPTIHVHDGTVHDAADFDHELYCQTPLAIAAEVPVGPQVGLEHASAAPQYRLDVDRTRGVVARDERLYRLELRGRRANADTRFHLQRA